MKKIVFLHIPKTAGQSVHQFLLDALPARNFCPARVNEQIKAMKMTEVEQYSVFSGHFDWDYFDFMDPKETFFFTVLREPMDRILSFYFFLRKKAQMLPPDELNSPACQGMHAALTLTPDQYFADPDLNIRGFIDDHYDNFYTSYFAGRNYHSHTEFKKKQITGDTLLDKAQRNLSRMNAIYTLNNWPRLVDDLKISQESLKQEQYFINKGDGLSVRERMIALEHLGATELTMQKLNTFCRLDQRLYSHFAN